MMIGVRADGTKELITVGNGYGDSADRSESEVRCVAALLASISP